MRARKPKHPIKNLHHAAKLAREADVATRRATRAAAKADEPPPPRKKHRFRNGTVVNREIRRLQKSTVPCIPLAPFARLVKEVFQDAEATFRTMFRITKSGVLALQQAAEDFIVKVFEDTVRIADHDHKRKTITPKV